MTLILFLLFVPILVYLVRAGLGNIEGLTKAAKISRLVFVSLAFLLSILLAAENINYYLVGYRSTSIVFLITAVAGIMYTLSDRRLILNSFERIFLNLLAVIFMMGSAFLVLEMIEDYDKQMVYSDSKFRLEFTGRAPLSPCGLPVLFVKNGIIERKAELITGETCISKKEILNVTVRDIDSAYMVNYFLIENLIDNDSNQLTIRYSKP